MPRITLACAVIAGITGTACSALLDDLSRGGRFDADGGGAAEVDDGAGGGTDTSSSPLDLDTDDAGPAPDNKVDDGTDAGAPLPAGCDLATFTPATVQSVGGGQGWQNAQDAVNDDGANATSTLSTDRRDSAPLVFRGFTTKDTIPAGAKIKGVMVDVDRSAGSTCIKANGMSANIAGTERPRLDANDLWQGIRFYGGLDDTWGAPAIAPGDLTSASFQISLATRMVGTQRQCPHARDARVDLLRVRVKWCMQ